MTHFNLKNIQRLPTITRTEIASSDKLLYIIGNKVIDATALIDKHPGGNRCLYNKQGTDISIDYKYHNTTAQKKISSMVVGVLEK